MFFEKILVESPFLAVIDPISLAATCCLKGYAGQSVIADRANESTWMSEVIAAGAMKVVMPSHSNAITPRLLSARVE